MAVTLSHPAVDPFLKQAAQYLEKSRDDLYHMTSLELRKKQKPGLVSNFLTRQELQPVIEVPANTSITITTTIITTFLPENAAPTSRQRHRPVHMEPRINQDVLLTAEDLSVYTSKLTKAVRLDIEANQAMENCESMKKILIKLKLLSKELSELNEIVEKILQVYALMSLGFPSPINLPRMDSLIKVQGNISHLRKQVQWTDLKELFQAYSIETTKEHILASILGLHEDFGDWLYDMDPKCRSHQGEMYHINTYIQDREAMLQEDEKLSISEVKDPQSLTQALTLLGFNQDKAEFIVQNVEKDLICLQPPSFWALRFLEHTMLYHPLIGNNTLYPFRNEWNQWFIQKFERKTGSETPGVKELAVIKEQAPHVEEVWMINVAKTDREAGALLVEDWLNSEAQDDSHQFLYHGTSHKNAMDILMQGLEVKGGRNNQDFSIGNGVYLSNSYSNALKWARSEDGEGGAVVVFKVPKQCFTEEEGVDLTNENTALNAQERQKQWERIVQYGRRGHYRKLRPELKKKANVKGPHCANPLRVAYGGEMPTGFNESSIQICIHDEELAEKISKLSNVCCVVFL